MIERTPVPYAKNCPRLAKVPRNQMNMTLLTSASRIK